MFQNKKLGFWLAFGAAALAVLGTIAYVAIYMLTAGDAVDRVFSWFTVGFMLAGGLLGIAGELLNLRFGPLVSCACYSLALANHAVEFAYPLADVLTRVPFFGGNYPLALAFVVLFGLIAVISVVAAFMEHTNCKE